MRTCQVCGAALADETIICPKCGCAVPREEKPDVPSWPLNIVALLLPLVGAILYATAREKHPRRARALALWTLLGIGLTALASVLIGKLAG